MPRYTLTTTQKTIFDGQLVQANTVIGVLETELPLGNVLSAAALGTVAASVVETTETVAVIARVDPAYADRKKPIATEDAVDPDDLNAVDAAEEAAEAAEAAKLEAEAAAKADDTEKATPEHTLEGLDTRIAKALARQQLTSREEIQAFIEEGKDLEDLDDIGRAAVKKIKAWLES